MPKGARRLPRRLMTSETASAAVQQFLRRPTERDTDDLRYPRQPSLDIMFPKPQNRPTLIRQPSRNEVIALHVAPNFRLPEFAVILRHNSVSWASVPEAAIHENDDPGGLEYYVWLAKYAAIEPVTYSHRAERLSKRQFRPCVPTSYSGHTPAALLRGEDVRPPPFTPVPHRRQEWKCQSPERTSNVRARPTLRPPRCPSADPSKS